MSFRKYSKIVNIVIKEVEGESSLRNKRNILRRAIEAHGGSSVKIVKMDVLRYKLADSVARELGLL